MWFVNFAIGSSILLFIIGLYGVITQRNLVKILLSAEIMMNGGIMVFVIAGTLGPSFTTLPMAFAIILIGLAEGTFAVGLAIIIIAYRHYRSLDVDKLKKLKW